MLSKESRPVGRGQFPTNRYVIFYSELASDQPFFCASQSAQPTAHWADNKEIKKLRNSPSTKSDLPRTSDGTTCRDRLTKDVEIREVEEVFLNLGIGTASTLNAAAIARGCATRSLIAIARWWQRSERCWPDRWQKPKSVLKIRLETATPNIPAVRGWIPGTRPAKPVQAKPKRDPHRSLAEAQQNRRAFIATGESMVEQLKKQRGW